jgi:mono/diheme cytochrome c family protein
MRRFRTLLPCAVLLLAACGGADDRDPDRTSLASRAPHDVMLSDTTAILTDTGPKPTGPVNGAEVFTKCAACHQTSGLGTPGAWPPLAGSEWLVNNPGVPIRIVLHGLHGPITVKGQSYNNSMQAWADQLSDDEIAAVLTYERSNWGNAASAVTAEQVKAVRDSTKEHTAPWTADELKDLIHK